MALDVRPTAFGYDDPQRSLRVEWSDGVTHHIPFNVLRRACPCAACKGEPGFRGRFSTDPGLHRGEDELADISLVGAYGLNVVWADGHNTGIYTYDRLRELGAASA